MKTTMWMLMTGLTLVILLGGCASTEPTTEAEKEKLHEQVVGAIERFQSVDPDMKKFFSEAHGYAVLPDVAKGGAGIGGAHGRGEVYEGGRMIGYCQMSQGTIGLQLGGQEYSQVIFFEDSAALARFKAGDYALAAQASAVAANKGASADAHYENGVLVFTLPRGGLMGEASVGGQKFSFEPVR